MERRKGHWRCRVSIPVLLTCKASALPSELHPHTKQLFKFSQGAGFVIGLYSYRMFGYNVELSLENIACVNTANYSKRIVFTQ